MKKMISLFRDVYGSNRQGGGFGINQQAIPRLSQGDIAAAKMQSLGTTAPLPNSVVTATTANNTQGSPQGDVVQVDVKLVSTLATNLKVEMFNFNRSQTVIANSEINDYQPVDAVGDTAAFNAPSSVADGYYFGYIPGVLTAYVNGAVSTPPAGTTTPNQVYWNRSGSAVYRPGYVSGVLPSGNVTISCVQCPYRELFRWSSKARFFVQSVKFQYSGSSANDQYDQQWTRTYNNVVGGTNKDNWVPRQYFTENQYQALTVTVPIYKIMTPDYGMTVNIVAGVTIVASLQMIVPKGSLSVQ